VGHLIRRYIIDLSVKFLNQFSKAPFKKRPEDAGWDISCVRDDTFVILEDKNLAYRVLLPGESHLFDSGIATSFPPGWVAMLKDRSGMGAIKCVHVFAGVIDNSYTGPWKVRLTNFGTEPITIAEGDRIAQVLFLPVPDVIVNIVEELPTSDRGDKGFGSSGK
jgi:dUTP pyrophosphatase